MKIAREPVCRICDSPESVIVSEEVSGAPEAKVFQCAACDIVYLHPIMGADEESDFYEQDFPPYMEARSAPGGTDAASNFISNLPEAERRIKFIRPHLDEAMSILEIGSSTGHFLFSLQGYVDSVTGVEPGRAFADYARCRGIRTFEKLGDIQNEQFDVILLYYVLEHMRDPVDCLSEIRRYLKPDGKLLLEVPNVEDVLFSTYDIPSFGPFYFQKAHYYNFSRKTLEAVMEKSGYKPQILPEQRYDLSNHLHWMMARRPGGKGKYSEIFSGTLESAYAETLKNHWLCDTLFGVGSTS